MQRARVIFIVIILVALAIVGAGLVMQAITGVGEPGTGSVDEPPVPAGAVVVEIHSSNTESMSAGEMGIDS